MKLSLIPGALFFLALSLISCDLVPDTIPVNDNPADPDNPVSIYSPNNLPVSSGVSFFDENTDEDTITGTMTISKASDETAVSGYRLYWGSAADTKLSGAPVLKEIEKTGSNLTVVFGGSESGSVTSSVPAGATHLLIYTYYGDYEAETPLAYDIEDRVVEMLVDVYENGDFDPEQLTVYNDLLFFQATSDDEGTELWVYDDTMDIDLTNVTATLRNPRIFQDIYSGTSSSNPTHFYEGSDRLYFAANAGSGYQIYSYSAGDTAAGAESSKADLISISYYYMAEVGGYFYFTGYDSTDYYELWYLRKIWPLTSNAIQLADINTASSPYSSYPRFFCGYDDKLYFQAEGNTKGAELWVFDPALGSTPALAVNLNDDIEDPSGGDYATANPKMVYDIAADTLDAYPQYLTVYDGSLYFAAAPTGGKKEIYSYNGSGAPVQVTTMEPNAGPADLTVFQDQLIFMVNDGVAGMGLSIYSYDGSTYERVRDYLSVEQSLYGDTFAVCGDLLFFCASDLTSDEGYEPWYYDGSDVRLLKDIYDGNNSNPEYFVQYNDKVYFMADDGIYGTELWVYYIK